MSDLSTAFSAAHFWTDAPTPLPERFVIVTAHNPDAVRTDAALNAAADARLHAELVADGHVPFRVTGGSPDRAHLEPGWGIATTDPEALGADLARRHRQLAFFWICAGDLWLVDTATLARTFVARWEERWIREPSDRANRTDRSPPTG